MVCLLFVKVVVDSYHTVAWFLSSRKREIATPSRGRDEMGGKRVATVVYFWMTWAARFFDFFKFQQVVYFGECLCVS